MPRMVTGISHVCLGLDRPIGAITIPAFVVVIHDELRPTTRDNLVVGYAVGQHDTPCFSISLGVDNGEAIALDPTISQFGRCDLIVDGDPNVELGCLSRSHPPTIERIPAEALPHALAVAEERHRQLLGEIQRSPDSAPDAAALTLPIPGVGH
jgi:hypothetical protein